MFTQASNEVLLKNSEKKYIYKILYLKYLLPFSLSEVVVYDPNPRLRPLLGHDVALGRGVALKHESALV